MSESGAGGVSTAAAASGIDAHLGARPRSHTIAAPPPAGSAIGEDQPLQATSAASTADAATPVAAAAATDIIATAPSVPPPTPASTSVARQHGGYEQVAHKLAERVRVLIDENARLRALLQQRTQ